MLISDHCVMINFPKTGTSFVRACLHELYANQARTANLFKRAAYALHAIPKPKLLELMLPNIEYAQTDYRVPDQHGKVSQIPQIHRHKPVVSITRNPFDRAVSGYEFGWWKNHLYDTVENIKAAFPNFPHLDFCEYLAFMDSQICHRIPAAIPQNDIGIQTVEFIQYYFYDPLDALTKLNDEYIYSGAYKRDMPDITLMHTEHLSDELHKYLFSLGFKESELAFILEKPRLRPGETERSSDTQRLTYWTPDLIKARLHKERYLFKILEDNGINYPLPMAHSPAQPQLQYSGLAGKK